MKFSTSTKPSTQTKSDNITTKQKNGLIWQDWLIIGALSLNAASRFLTNYLTSTLSAYVQQANVLETNPVARASLNSYLLQFIMFTLECAILTTIYLAIRKIRDKDESTKVIFNFMTITAFLIMFFDCVNDLSIVLGIILH